MPRPLDERILNAARKAVDTAPTHDGHGRLLSRSHAVDVSARRSAAITLMVLANDIAADGSTGRLITVSELRELAERIDATADEGDHHA